MKKILGVLKKIAIVLAVLVVIGAVFGGDDESSSSSSSDTQSEAAIEQEATDEEAEDTSNEKEPEAEEEPEPEPEPEEEAPIEYQSVTVDELTALLDENPLKAKQTYQDAHIKLTGVLYNIDSSGAYFNLNNGDQYSFDSVYCAILDDATLDKIANSSIGDTLTVCGTVTDVGEVLGYYMDVDCIE